MRRNRKGLGAPDSDHLIAAQSYVDKAWLDLERMPPTCEGGIQLATRAFGNAERAHAELDSIGDRAIREANTELFGLANHASSAAWKTVQFFSQTCKAPFPEAGNRPTFSRAKLLKPAKKTRAKRARKS